MNGLWLADEPLVLASGSAARRLLLEAAGLPVVVHPADLDERAIERSLLAAGAGPDAVALGLARAKALAVGRLRPGALVLGCDQTLAIGARQLHKPASREEARSQLAELAGAMHGLASAAVLVRDETVLFDTVGRATLTMRPLSDGFIARYLDVAGDAALRSVGSYQFEGLGAHLFERVEGDHATILGLPLLPVLDALRTRGVLAG